MPLNCEQTHSGTVCSTQCFCGSSNSSSVIPKASDANGGTGAEVSFIIQSATGGLGTPAAVVMITIVGHCWTMTSCSLFSQYGDGPRPIPLTMAVGTTDGEEYSMS